MSRRVRDERGNAAVEVAILGTVMTLLVLLGVAFTRASDAKLDVTTASADAARAASLAPDPGAAKSAARTAATDALRRSGLSCPQVMVRLDASEYRSGGSIAVTVTCRPRFTDLAMTGFLRGASWSHTALVPIEKTRAP